MNTKFQKFFLKDIQRKCGNKRLWLHATYSIHFGTMSNIPDLKTLQIDDKNYFDKALKNEYENKQCKRDSIIWIFQLLQ